MNSMKIYFFPLSSLKYDILTCLIENAPSLCDDLWIAYGNDSKKLEGRQDCDDSSPRLPLIRRADQLLNWGSKEKE